MKKPKLFIFIIFVSFILFACMNTASRISGNNSTEAAIDNKILSLAKGLSSIVDKNVIITENSPEIQKRFLAFEFIPANQAATLPYRLYLPDSYTDTGDPLPLLIFLHGSGESGLDNKIQISINTPFDLLILNNEISTELPCIIAAPQCPFSFWSHPIIMSALTELADTLANNLNVEKSRIYVTGLSMGGYGTFDILLHRNELFAAGMPICGGSVYGMQIAEGIINIPIWAFHAADDDDVPVWNSRNIVNAVEDLNGKFMKYTEFETGGHHIWFGIYSDPEILRWLFQQKK